MSMRLTRVVLFFLSLSLYFSSHSLAEEAGSGNISITTFNIKFYGTNGVFGGQVGTETRDDKIKAHLNRYQIWSDVIVFQEIVDVTALKNLMSEDYFCRSYDHENSAHQHVVLCHKKKFSFITASDDDNYALEDVSLNQYRPALHGILVNERGERLLHVFGVHLKAQPHCSDIRERQMTILGDYLMSRVDREPAIILGDFNTFNDDPTKFSQILAQDPIDMKQAENSYQYTYRSGTRGSKLDRIWHSTSLQVSEPAKVSGPCNETSGNNRAIKTYNKDVSDHCPVTIKVKVSTTKSSD